jgi:hypothetical protein
MQNGYQTKHIVAKKPQALDREMIEKMQESKDSKRKQWRPKETKVASKWTATKA